MATADKYFLNEEDGADQHSSSDKYRKSKRSMAMLIRLLMVLQIHWLQPLLTSANLLQTSSPDVFKDLKFSISLESMSCHLVTPTRIPLARLTNY